MVVNLKHSINREYMTKYNFTKSTAKLNRFLVIHFVGATGGAKANVKYFQQPDRGASAHVFVDHSGKLYQSVDFDDIAWHVGAKKYTHDSCRNTNSIGIELCCKKDKNGKWYFTEATRLSAIELTATLMLQYDIPISNVVRHYDVTGKLCPEPYVNNDVWKEFLKEVKKTYAAALGKYVTLAISTLRDTHLNKVPDINALSAAMREKCMQEKNKVMVKKGSVFQIVGIKQDSTDGNIWGITKSGYCIPIEYNNGIKAAKL